MEPVRWLRQVIMTCGDLGVCPVTSIDGHQIGDGQAGQRNGPWWKHETRQSHQSFNTHRIS